MTRISGRVVRFTREYWAIFILLGVCFSIGLSTVRNYGESWDESSYRAYGLYALNSYSPRTERYDESILADAHGSSILKYYGPSYTMLANLIVRGLLYVSGGWRPTDIWHFVNFGVFLAGIYLIWRLSKRIVGSLAAFGVALLFASQPLLWGHAFINPKDIPFMVMFLFTVESGLWMTQDIKNAWEQAEKRSGSDPSLAGLFKRDINETGNKYKTSVLVAFLFSFSLFIFLLVNTLPLYLLLESVIKTAYTTPDNLVGQVFSKFAVNAGSTPQEAYVAKMMIFYYRLISSIFALLVLILFVGALIHFRRTLNEMTKRFWRILPRGKAIIRIAIAGFLLGFCTSMRVIGPLAGILVSIYCLITFGKKIVPGLALYAAIALSGCFLSWPFLWTDPIHNFIESITTMANFPDLTFLLFNGKLYYSNNPPLTYFPTLFVLTLTEPVLFLFLSGLILGFFELVRKKLRPLLVILLLWFIMPVLYILLARPNLYDNNRQFLFIYPPVFILAGYTLDKMIQWSSRDHAGQVWMRKLKVIIIIALFIISILPGVIAEIRLTPYQYSYYNSLVGGEAGAFRRFEEDYWLTSYKEAAEFLNHTVKHDTNVVVYGPSYIFQGYASEILSVKKYAAGAELNPEVEYVVVPTRSNLDQTIFPEWNVIKTIGRGGGIFVVIKSKTH